MIDTLPDVTHLAGQARRVETPGGPGALVWHVWGGGDRPPLLLLHGGSGSWTHWVRNIAPLVAAGWQVLVPDMPGFGDSAAPPDGEDADVLPAWLEAGLQQLIGQAPLPVVGFSFGALVAGLWTQLAPARISRLVLVGSPSLSAERLQPLDLRRWDRLPAGPGRDAVHRHNLLQLMLTDEAAATPLAVALHAANVERDRLRRRRLMLTDALAPLPVVGFSFGALVAGWWAQLAPARISRLVLVGSPGLSAERLQPLDLRRWDGLPAGPARDAVHRHNLLQLMLADEAAATPLAVALHAANVERDRLRRRLMLTDALVPLLPTLACPVQGIWGSEDVLYRHRRPLIGRVLGTAPRFGGLVLLPGAGHWVAFEAAAAFNAALGGMLGEPGGSLG